MPAARQARFRERLLAEGLTQLNVVVPIDAVSDMAIMADNLRVNRNLAPGFLIDKRTRRIVSLQRRS